MSAKMTTHERKNTQLIAIFDEILRKRPELLEEVPSGASLVMQIEGDEAFNTWAQHVAEKNSPECPKFFVRFTFKTPVASKKPLSWKQVGELELQSAV